MSDIKLSELPPFVGQKLLIEAQRRGFEMLPPEIRFKLTATDVTMLGLAMMLVETGVMRDGP